MHEFVHAYRSVTNTRTWSNNELLPERIKLPSGKVETIRTEREELETTGLTSWARHPTNVRKITENIVLKEHGRRLRAGYGADRFEGNVNVGGNPYPSEK
jgi:hypothetical protein